MKLNRPGEGEGAGELAADFTTFSLPRNAANIDSFCPSWGESSVLKCTFCINDVGHMVNAKSCGWILNSKA